MVASGTVHLGIISDTHIPDRSQALPGKILNAFAKADLHAILHAGDVCSQSVLEQLSEIAPVLSVQGNRDWLYGFKLPRYLEPTFNGVTLTLTHGHISLTQYFFDLVHYSWHGFNFQRSFLNLKKQYPKARVIIFGHTHRQVYTYFDGVTFINPGAALPCVFNNHHPQYCLLHIKENGEISVDCCSA